MAPHSSAPTSDVCEASSVPQPLPQTVKSRKLKQKKLFKNSPVIKMCNTKLNNNSENEKHNASQSLVKDSQCYETERVPPLPILTEDNLLAQAVESLDISSSNPSKHLPKRRNKKKQCIPVENKENLSNTPLLSVESNDYSISPALCYSSNSEFPSGQVENICTSQRCGACGLEFQSVESLSQHLLRHIYEGMYAAQWLTQAMALVSQQQQQQQQTTATVEQQDVVFMSQHQEQYTTTLHQQQPPSQLILQQQQKAPTIPQQALLPSPTLHTDIMYSQDTTISHEIKSLYERNISTEIIPVIETDPTEAQSSPLIQQIVNSQEVSNQKQISNHSSLSPQC